MKMEPEDDKYEKVLEILKASGPVLNSPDEIGDNVVRRISSLDKNRRSLSDLVDFLFGWTYIGWVRRSLVTASVVMVAVFIFQQGIILKEISQIGRQIETRSTDAPAFSTRDLDRSMVLFRFSDRRFRIDKTTFPDKKVEELLKSIDDLKMKYRDLQELIEKDPELKKMIEKKLSEIDGTRIKL